MLLTYIDVGAVVVNVLLGSAAVLEDVVVVAVVDDEDPAWLDHPTEVFETFLEVNTLTLIDSRKCESGHCFGGQPCVTSGKQLSLQFSCQCQCILFPCDRSGLRGSPAGGQRSFPCR